MQYKEQISATLRDRPYLLTIAGIALVALVGIIYIALTVEPRDIQVATRYVTYGDTNYYKGRWYSLYSFAALFLAIAIGHAALMMKFRALERRDFGLIFGFGTIVVLVIGILYAANVIQQIAFI